MLGTPNAGRNIQDMCVLLAKICLIYNIIFILLKIALDIVTIQGNLTDSIACNSGETLYINTLSLHLFQNLFDFVTPNDY